MGICEKITVIIGLPSSGKIALATSLLDENTIIIDNPKDFTEVVSAIENNKKVIISDPKLCLPQLYRAIVTILSAWQVKKEYIFFENNPEQCKKNNRKKKIREIIDFYSKSYKIPETVKPKKVYKA